MKVDVVVVGGGIVGLATALRLIEARPGCKIVVLEKERQIAQHQTGHNSGVIHSGLYYKPGSLKASMCRDGYRSLVQFCEQNSIAHEICGKIVVASNREELSQLDDLYERGIANGLVGIQRLSAQEIRDREPHCAGVAGLLVPETGIVDYKAVCDAYVKRLQEFGAVVKTGSTVTSISNRADEVRVNTETESWAAQVVITCAGLQSDRVTKLTVSELDVRILPFRGEYFTLRTDAVSLVKNLIYPVPNPNFPFLGVHFTRMVGGGIECGPNAVLALAREGYKKTDFSARDVWETISWPGFRSVARKYWKTGAGEYYRSFSKRGFTKALQKLIPEIRAEHLIPAEAGVRAQACDRVGGLLDDFSIRQVGRVVNVCNAPSPAATASLAIGASIAQIAIGILG